MADLDCVLVSLILHSRVNPDRTGDRVENDLCVVLVAEILNVVEQVLDPLVCAPAPAPDPYPGPYPDPVHLASGLGTLAHLHLQSASMSVTLAGLPAVAANSPTPGPTKREPVIFSIQSGSSKWQAKQLFLALAMRAKLNKAYLDYRDILLLRLVDG